MNRLLSMFSKSGRCPPLKSAQSAAAKKYRSFRTFLNHNHAALNAIADMETLYYSGTPFSLTSVRIQYEELIEAVTGAIYSLESLAGRDYSALLDVSARMDSELFRDFNPRCALPAGNFIVHLEEVTPDMYRMVGAKAANLAAIKNDIGLPVPHGFVITAHAFEQFIKDNALLRPIKEELSRVTSESPAAIEKGGQRLRDMILGAQVSARMEEQIMRAYAALEDKTSKGVHIAMRSSAVGEDTEATFAGQYDTVLNVNGENIINAYKVVLASKYSGRAIAYRLHYGLDDRETPMCVLGLVMIDPSSSGVLYSVDPSSPRSCPVRINSLWGIGEHLVDGSASADVFIVDRTEGSIIKKHIAKKETRLINLHTGGTVLEFVPEHERDISSLDDRTALQLAGYGLLLEKYFENPQDVEWTVDGDHNIFILQSRPLLLPAANIGPAQHLISSENPVLLSGGKTASGGTATGRVFILEKEQDLMQLPGDTILVATIASPGYAKVIGMIRGIITDIGSIASHMSSVAREFGIPAIVDAGNATTLLPHGEVVTMSADTVTVYKGIVEELAAEIRPTRKPIFDSPLHRRMRSILDRISPLNLTDTEAASFSSEGCRTYHDIVRFTHESAIREMFGISKASSQSGPSVRLTCSLPLNLWLIDLGDGLSEGLTTCDRITPEKMESVPMRAVWRGFTHPGVNWAGTMSFSTGKLSGMLAASALSEFGEIAGGQSYALLSKDYLNLSVRFAYHFATIDTLCSDNESQNYISLQFSGGAGNYYGRSLRVQLIANILEKLGFGVSIKGDLIDAFISRHDRNSTEEKLDMVARLLASTRLLDVTLSNQDELAAHTASFLKGTYDFLSGENEGALQIFYLRSGHWTLIAEDGHTCLLQNGSHWGKRTASAVSGLMGKVIGSTYHEFLDTIEAYHYFPIAIVKERELSEGTVSVNIKPIRGNIDRAGGIAFGIKDVDNYFVLTINALVGKVTLFEYKNGERSEVRGMRSDIETGKWHHLVVEIAGQSIRGYTNDKLSIEYATDRSLRGYVGLWTKSDSVTFFDELVLESNGRKDRIEFSVCT